MYWYVFVNVCLCVCVCLSINVTLASLGRTVSDVVRDVRWVPNLSLEWEAAVLCDMMGFCVNYALITLPLRSRHESG